MPTYKPWPRKPSNNSDWVQFRNEDLFKCIKCKIWFPWFHFETGKEYLLFSKDVPCNATYLYMNDEYDRGGKMWACDKCFDECIENNRLINHNYT
jgi:hypothetical protein